MVRVQGETTAQHQAQFPTQTRHEIVLTLLFRLCHGPSSTLLYQVHAHPFVTHFPVYGLSRYD